MANMYQDQLKNLFRKISDTPSWHSSLSSEYKQLKTDASLILTELYGENSSQSAHFAGIGEIQLPFFSMGNVNSVNLFDLDELIIFAFYNLSKERYKSSLDIGANLGLHSIVMAKLGFQVTSFEPDPVHYEKLLSNSSLNNVSSTIHLVKAAVSNTSGKAEFTRVLGNTTGSHLSTAKTGAYGQLEKFEVNVVNIADYSSSVDLIKLDAEGEELKILQGIDANSWDHLDIIAEVGSEHNGQEILDHLESIDVKVYAQKLEWERVKSSSGMPTSYKEGSVFISRNNSTPWSEI